MSIQDYLIDIGLFINYTIIPFLFSLALLFFIFNAARYFILNAAEEKAREQARQLALYGVGAFIFWVSIWGIVNAIASGLGVDDDRALCPDYLGSWCDYDPYGDSFYNSSNSLNLPNTAPTPYSPDVRTPDTAPIPSWRDN